MSQRIEEKQAQLSLEIEAFQHHRAELLELIRATPAFFYQLLAHLETSKVETFLEKDEKYQSRKLFIEKMKDEIFEDEMKEREGQLILMNLPETMRRACVQAECSACLLKHNWTGVVMLGCGHVLHEECVKKLRKNECPFDRREIARPGNSYGGGIFGAHREDDDYWCYLLIFISLLSEKLYFLDCSYKNEIWVIF